MALTIGSLKLLLSNHVNLDKSGKVLTLGNFESLITKKNLLLIMKNDSDNLKEIQKLVLNLENEDIVDSTLILKLIGFDEVHSIDYYNSGATYQVDLNLDDLEFIDCKYDFILDFGMLEHIFDAPNLLSKLNKLLNINGQIIHYNPTIGNFNHGFYSFQPTFYYSYYGANKFENLKCFLVEEIHHESTNNAAESHFVYSIPNINNCQFLPSDGNPYLFFIAKKILPIVINPYPVQEFYYKISKEKSKVENKKIDNQTYEDILGKNFDLSIIHASKFTI